MIYAVDSETECFGPGNMAPPIVCVTYCNGKDSGILHVDEAHDFVAQALTQEIVGQNVAYDTACICAQWPDLIPAVFQAYDEDRVTDTMLRQKLLDIAAGEYGVRPAQAHEHAGTKGGVRWIKHNYGLADLARRFLGKKLDKDTWRTGYAELKPFPIAEWPQGAIDYAVGDAVTTFEIYELQEKHAEYLQDQFRQARAAFALHLSSVHGIRTDINAVRVFASEMRAEYNQVKDFLVSAGLVRPDGSRNLKAAQAAMVAACNRLGQEIRVTDKGNVSLDKDACDAVEDELIEEYSEFLTLGKIISTDVPTLERGSIEPLHTRYGMAASGRTTSSGPNIQNLRRKAGIRECFVPRPGYVFADADYAALELHTLAQVCLTMFGYSLLADALNAGIDPHTSLAANLVGVSYEEGVKLKKSGDHDFDNARQSSKISNFGYPGGLGAATFIKFARKSYGVIITEAEAVVLKAQWFVTWPEMKDYFAAINDAGDSIEQLYTKRQRGGMSYCAAANTLFQGLGADCAKEALWLVTKACYNEPGSPLYGSRIAAFIHDQIVCESPLAGDPSAAAFELARLMRLGADKYLVDVHTKVEPLLMDRWSKSAKPLYSEDGSLIVYQVNV